jgi:putative endopeptidase
MTTAAFQTPSGIALAHMDSSIRPQDDLFRFVNGGWMKSAEIPSDRSSYGAFYWLIENAEQQVREIIEGLAESSQPAGSIAQKIGDLYASFMNQARINELGAAPVKPDLAAAFAITNRAEFISTLGEFETRGLGGVFYEYISSDDMSPNDTIAYFGQSGLSLPDEAYYRDEQYEPIRQEFLKHVARMFELADISEGAKLADQVLALETEIAGHHWDQVEDRDAEKTYNKLSYAELKALAPAFDWDTWLTASRTPVAVVEKLIVRQPSFFAGLSSMLEKFEVEKWRAWLAWHALSARAASLSDEFVNQNFAFYGTVLSGTPELRTRWKRGVSLVEGSLGEAVGQIYVERHFSPAAKARVSELVTNLTEAYRASISELDWMSPVTKVKALEKLDLFTTKIGYPDKWRDYSALEISPDDLIANLDRIARFSHDYQVGKIGKPVDRSEWHMTPQTVNAYYNPGGNEIVFPAAILQPPFFNESADDAVNYGGIGGVIGHEIGHGFDDQGSKYDGSGALNDWWSEADRTAFESRTQKLISQFDALAPAEAPDLRVNGALTIGENIGDLGGLTIALKAYTVSLAGKLAPVIDGYTGEQRVFLGWAQVWLQKMREESRRQMIAVDPHSPPEFRVNQIVKNLNEFHDAFATTPADAMFTPITERIRIW